MAENRDSLSRPPTNSPHSPLSLTKLRVLLAQPTDALPLDLFRVLLGILAFAYFLRTFFEAGDFSGPDGLIDHELSLQIFWFTRVSLFRPGMTLVVLQSIFLFACLCSLALIIGYRVKLSAAILYLIAVCTYRWNFLVIYVDDAIMHLMLVWMLLLPVGRTLVLSELLTNKERAWRSWKSRTVPGMTVRCFLWNLALIYLVAGLWKWTSPMWRDGTALYAVLRLPVSYAPEFWGPQHLSALKVLDYATLVIEPLFPLIFILPKGHRAKYGLLLALLAFHLGSVATLKIPFANLACVAATVVIFGSELMSRIRKPGAELSTVRGPAVMDFSGAFAILLVTTLTLAMISSVTLPQWRMPSRRQDNSDVQNILSSSATGILEARGTDHLGKGGDEGLSSFQMAFFAPLWCVGIAQQYQLFNWIDERNYSVHYQVMARDGIAPVREIDPDTVFLKSTRGILLQFNLLGLTWVKIPPERRAELRRSIYIRLARRYCESSHPRGEISVYSVLERITAADSIPDREAPNLLIEFSCQNNDAQFHFMNLDP